MEDEKKVEMGGAEASYPAVRNIFSAGLVFGAAFALGIALVLIANPFFNWDASSYLYWARLWLNGVPLYGPAIQEANPPLIIWISAAPVGIARLLGCSSVIVAKICCLLACAASALISTRLLYRRTNLNAAWVRAFGLAVFLLLISLPTLDFGQREHLLALLFTPYIVSCLKPSARIARNRSGHFEQIAIGIAAGLAISLKPYHLVTLAAVEMASVDGRRLRERFLRPELIALLLTGATYLMVVRIACPAYYSAVAPLLHEVYWAFSIPHTADAIFSSFCAPPDLAILLLIFAIPIFLLRYTRALQITRLPILFYAAGAGAYVAYLLQWKGWTYHRLPAELFLSYSVAAIVIQAAQHFQYTPLGQFRPNTLAVIAGIGLLLSAYVGNFRYGTAKTLEANLDGQVLKSAPRGSAVYVMNISLLLPFYLIEERHLVWGSRYVDLWTLPAIIRSGPDYPGPTRRLPAAEAEKLAAGLRQAMSEDLAHFAPRTVLVRKCSEEFPCQAIEGADLNLVDWFSQSPPFQRVWSNYVYSETRDGYDLYRLR